MHSGKAAEMGSRRCSTSSSSSERPLAAAIQPQHEEQDDETRVAAAALLAVAEISPSSVMDVRTALDKKASKKAAIRSGDERGGSADHSSGGGSRKRQRMSSPPRSLEQPTLTPQASARKPSERKSVRFARDSVTDKIQKAFIPQGEASAAVDEKWISRSELRASIRQTDMIIDDLKRNNLPYFQTMLGMFQKCSKPAPNLPDLLRQNRATFTNPPEEVRGLERNLHKMLSQYKSFHVRNLLKHQRTKDGKLQPSSTLRGIALKTSRLSRAFAILLGQGDSMWVAQMVRSELDEQQRTKREKRQRERVARLPPPPDTDIIEIADSSESSS